MTPTLINRSHPPFKDCADPNSCVSARNVSGCVVQHIVYRAGVRAAFEALVAALK